MEAEPEPGADAPGGLLLAGVLLVDGRRVDVRLSGERIEAVGAAGSLRAAERLDLGGYLLLPAPAEPHAHLDEALTAGALDRAPDEDLRRRITEAALTCLGYGSTAVRTHVLVSPATGLARLDAALQAAADLRGLMDLQVTAMPGPLTGAPGHEGRALLREAARVGVHALGGCPDADPEPDGHLAALLELSQSCGLPLDLHVGSPRRLDRLPLNGLPAGSLLTLAGPAPRPSAIAALGVAATGVGVVLLPQGGCCAGPHGPQGFDAATARRLAEAGVPLAAGSGALRDALRPVGRADPIESAFLLSAQAGLSVSAAYEAIGPGARALLGLPPSAVEAGLPGDLLALRGETLTTALSGGHSRVVLHAGRVVSRTSAVREYADTTTAAVPRQVRPPRPA
jgi:cytosine deaminase